MFRSHWPRPQAGRTELQLSVAHPINAGISRLVTKAEQAASQWVVKTIDNTPVLVLARREDTSRPAIWLRPRGAGSILVSAWASPFANGQLGKGDNARWFAQLVGWAVDEGGAVIFDDMHQGASLLRSAEIAIRN